MRTQRLELPTHVTPSQPASVGTYRYRLSGSFAAAKWVMTDSNPLSLSIYIYILQFSYQTCIYTVAWFPPNGDAAAMFAATVTNLYAVLSARQGCEEKNVVCDVLHNCAHEIGAIFSFGP